MSFFFKKKAAGKKLYVIRVIVGGFLCKLFHIFRGYKKPPLPEATGKSGKKKGSCLLIWCRQWAHDWRESTPKSRHKRSKGRNGLLPIPTFECMQLLKRFGLFFDLFTTDTSKQNQPRSQQHHRSWFRNGGSGTVPSNERHGGYLTAIVEP